MPLEELSIPAIRLLPLFPDEFSSSDANGNCLHLPQDLICVNIYTHYGAISFDYLKSDVTIKVRIIFKQFTS